MARELDPHRPGADPVEHSTLLFLVQSLLEDTRSVGAEQFAYSPQSEAVATTEPAGLSGGEGGGETGNP